MSVPLAIKITFLGEVVVRSFGVRPPLQSEEARRDWITNKVQTEFNATIGPHLEDLILLSNTIHTLEEARDEKQLYLQQQQQQTNFFAMSSLGAPPPLPPPPLPHPPVVSSLSTQFDEDGLEEKIGDMNLFDDGEPPSQRQESNNSGYSNTILTFGISPTIPSHVSLHRFLTTICQIEPTVDVNDQDSLFRELEDNRTDLEKAFRRRPHRNAQCPQSLAEAVEIGLSETTTENQLQTLCFHDLRIIGESFCLENTSNKVFGRDEDDEFRKLNIAPFYDKPSQPNITVRFKLPSDQTMKKCGSGKITLEPYRLIPWLVVAYVELKKWNENLDDHVNQALYYSQQTLSCCPNRNYFITALYNFRSIKFCMTFYDNGQMKYRQTKTKFGTEASHELARFLSLDLQTMGYAGEFPVGQCTPTRALGRGSTAVCLEVQHDRTIYVAKISRNRRGLEVERVILQYLKMKNDTLAVPSVVTPKSNPNLYNLFASPPNQSPYVSFLTEVYVRKSRSQLDLKLFTEDVWNILKEVHKLGICHRDIRFPNLGFKLVGGTYQVYLLDWSSSKPFIRSIPDLPDIDNGDYLQGSTCTASSKVSEQMSQNLNNYTCYPSDEAISLIYLAYQLKVDRKDLYQPFDIRIAKDVWAAEREIMTSSVLESIDALEQMDRPDAPSQHRATIAYSGFGGVDFVPDSVNAYLEIIEGHVKTALVGIFPSDAERTEIER